MESLLSCVSVLQPLQGRTVVTPTAPQPLNPVLSPAAALMGCLPVSCCHADVSMQLGREGPA